MIIIGLLVLLMAAWGLSTLTKGVVALAEWRQRHAGPHRRWYEPVTNAAPPAERTVGLGRLLLAAAILFGGLIWLAHL